VSGRRSGLVSHVGGCLDADPVALQFAGLTILQNGVENIQALRKELGYGSKKRDIHSTMDRLRAQVDGIERGTGGSEWTARRFGRQIYRLAACLLVLPLVVGLFLELYVLFPLKYGISDMTPVFYASEAW
jgi:hypothetical protein